MKTVKCGANSHIAEIKIGADTIKIISSSNSFHQDLAYIFKSTQASYQEDGEEPSFQHAVSDTENMITVTGDIKMAIQWLTDSKLILKDHSANVLKAIEEEEKIDESTSISPKN